MNESFNAELAIDAMKNATSEIESACSKFENTREKIYAELGASGSSVGGNLGAAAESAFESGESSSFASLSKNLESFMSRVETIIKNSSTVVETTSSIYGGQS